jgi:flagellin
MGFKVSTNMNAINAHQLGVMNNREISDSLKKLSSGLRINSASDDASGTAISNNLRNQAKSLGQAIMNANDGVGIIQTADNALNESIKILDTIKTKAVQAAQDGQTEDTRSMLQKDIEKLMMELDNIANTTSFNGTQLLSGEFTNKPFHIGAYTNETVMVSIKSSSSDNIGFTRFETGARITASSNVGLKFLNADDKSQLENVIISTSVGTGIGQLSDVINKNSDKLGVRASWNVITTGEHSISTISYIDNFNINGIQIGRIDNLTNNDSNGLLVNSINAHTNSHGVVASIDNRGHLELTSSDGRGIVVDGTNLSAIGINNMKENYGRLSLVRLDGTDINLSGVNFSNIGFGYGQESQETINLKDIRGGFTVEQADAMGSFGNENSSQLSMASIGFFGNTSKAGVGISSGVTTLRGAMAVMDIAESAIKNLDDIRANLGSTQNQLTVTVTTISVTQVNIKASESGIRDVDFAEESANFNKYSLLSQSGNFAISQATQTQEHILKLLQ